jgi:hypothetical protein
VGNSHVNPGDDAFLTPPVSSPMIPATRPAAPFGNPGRDASVSSPLQFPRRPRIVQHGREKQEMENLYEEPGD